MDGARFDTLIRRLSEARSRRGVLAGLAGGALGLLGLTGASAKKKHHKHKHKKKRGGSSPPGSPPPLSATCGNGVKDGTETDTDCGGQCARCGDGKACIQANDCVSGTCTGGACVTCTVSQLCGSDAHGSCRCDQEFSTGNSVCDSAPMLGLTVMSCAECPPGTETCVTINGLLFNCYKRCGSA